MGRSARGSPPLATHGLRAGRWGRDRHAGGRVLRRVPQAEGRSALRPGGAALARYAPLACEGGKILLSQATSALLDDEEHDGSTFTLVDLGEHQLKDFDRPVRVYQLV